MDEDANEPLQKEEYIISDQVPLYEHRGKVKSRSLEQVRVTIRNDKVQCIFAPLTGTKLLHLRRPISVTSPTATLLNISNDMHLLVNELH